MSVNGYGVELHYCLGQITDVNYALFDTSCACEDHRTVKLPGCCEEKVLFVQVDEDHHSTSKLDISSSADLVPDYQVMEDAITERTPKLIYFDRGPPRVSDLRILYCSFQFYG